jgi:DNA-directed RNA polymerase subunit RPC12/RpoP
MTKYSCKACSKEVTRAEDGSFIRPCGCNETIVADLRATVSGISYVSTPKA